MKQRCSMKDDSTSVKHGCNHCENDYDHNQIMAYARFLHSLSGLEQIAIRCYQVSGTCQGGSRDQQTECAYVLIEILKEANQKIVRILSDDTPVREDVPEDEQCPEGFYRCRGECIHQSMPCP